MALKPSERAKLRQAKGTVDKELTIDDEVAEIQNLYKNKKTEFFDRMLGKKNVTYEEEFTFYKDNDHIFISKHDVVINRALQPKLIKVVNFLALSVAFIFLAGIFLAFNEAATSFYTVENNGKVLCANTFYNSNGQLVNVTTPSRVLNCETLNNGGGF